MTDPDLQKFLSEMEASIDEYDFEEALVLWENIRPQLS